MNIQIGRHRRIYPIEELAELDRAVAPVTLTDHFAGLRVESGEQGRGTMPNVIMRALFRLAGPHGQQRSGAVQRLNLGLLVHAKDQGSIKAG